MDNSFLLNQGLKSWNFWKVLDHFVSHAQSKKGHFRNFLLAKEETSELNSSAEDLLKHLYGLKAM